MKVGGKVIVPPKDKILVIPRDGVDVVFKAQPVLDYTEFDKICPEPTAPEIRYKDGRVEKDYNVPTFRDAIRKRINIRSNWVILTSLAPSNIEWDTVDLKKPETYENYSSELSKSGFSDYEIEKIHYLIVEANNMDEKRYDEAFKRFTQSQAKVNTQ